MRPPDQAATATGGATGAAPVRARTVGPVLVLYPLGRRDDRQDRQPRSPGPDLRARDQVRRTPCATYDIDLWFAASPAALEEAKLLCGDCFDRDACLAGAIERREPWGVWGGEIFDGGVVVPFKRGRGRPPRSA